MRDARIRRPRPPVLAGLGLIALCGLALGLVRYGGPEGLYRRAYAEIAPRLPHPSFVPTPLVAALSVELASAPDTPGEAEHLAPVSRATPAPPSTSAGPRAGTAEAATDAQMIEAADVAPAERLPATATPRLRARPEQPPPATATSPGLPRAPTSPAPIPVEVPPAVRLTGLQHAWQTWNNCGPATLAMYLSFFGEKMDQAAAGAALRPFKDDKNVSPEELAEYARRQGLNAISRVNGDELLLRRLVAAGVPVLIETWYEPKPNDGMGHYRLITGYDDSRREWIAYDSYDSSGIVRGAPYEGIRLSYSDFDRLWKVFNRTYLLLYDDAHRSAVEGIIGSDLEDDAMWQRALDAASIEAESSPADPFAHFNLGSAQVAVGNYSAAAESYDRARVLGLPWRMLWYQFGPFRAYYEIGRMDEVLALANATLRSTKSLEEAWFWRGLAHNALGDRVAARDAWSRALSLRPNYPDALAAMESLR